MKLHIFAPSPNCRKILALIHYLDMDVEINNLNFVEGEHKEAETMAINPNGAVPVLEDGDYKIWESNAILEYLADKHIAEHGDNAIYPKDAKKRATIKQWLYWQTAHYGSAISTIAWENFAKPVFGLGDANPALIKDGLERFHKYAPVLEAELKKHDFVAGDQMTIADFAMANTAAVHEAGKVPVGDYPAITAWYARMDKQDAWAKAAPPPFTP